VSGAVSKVALMSPAVPENSRLPLPAIVMLPVVTPMLPPPPDGAPVLAKSVPSNVTVPAPLCLIIKPPRDCPPCWKRWSSAAS
jgi:hypothetical protein